MPDIQLRFQKDMLVLSAPIDALLARQGIDASLDRQYLNLMEPDSIHDALNLELIAGAQCLVTTTEDITQARLAHLRMCDDAPRLAQSALDIVTSLKPQHVIVEIGPCGLPLDAASKASLNENRSQYANAARLFMQDAPESIDAFFLNGFTSIPDLKCALMGVAQATDKPVLASVTVGEQPLAPADSASQAASADSPEAQEPIDLMFGGSAEMLDKPASPPLPAARRSVLAPDQWEEAVDVMVDLGAAVVGFETAEPVARAVAYTQAAVARTELPVLAQLFVRQADAQLSRKSLVPLDDIDEYTPDTLALAAVKLRAAGAQFLRATGEATPAYTGALAATVSGLDVHRG